MQDMIRKMLDVEAKARQIVEEAETEARKAMARATEAAHNRRNAALEQARREAREAIAQAESAAHEAKTEALQARRADLQASVQVSNDDVAAAAQKVAAAVLGLSE